MEATTQTVNWLPDSNRWNLPVPPPWFLKRLYDFDSMLVLIPSRKKVKGERPAYLLCRRRLHSAGLGDVAMLDNKHPDTNMCYQHSVVPIAPLRFKANQVAFTEPGCDSLIADLKARDMWAVSGGPDGNADKIWKDIEYAEQLQKRKERHNLRDMFYHRARDAYRSLTARVGRRNQRASSNRHAGHTPKPPTSSGVILTDAQ